MQRIVVACWVGWLMCGACSADPVDQRVATATPGGALPAAHPGTANLGGSPALGAAPVMPMTPPPLPAAPLAPASPAGRVCRETHVDVQPQVPDMMIVLDRSGSMGEQGRWDPSLSALKRVTEQLQDRIHFGLAMFPDPSATGTMVDLESCLNKPDVNACLDEMLRDVNRAACAPGRIVVPVAPVNASAITQALDAAGPLGGTPTPETLEALLTTFATPMSGAPAMPAGPAKYVLLVTDGQPTCPAGDGSETTQADIDATNTAVEALARSGVKTYVIGYDTTGPDNEMLAEVLDGLATRGGTGDMTHRSVEDEASLVLELQRIAASLVECSFVLDMPPARVDHVLVELDGEQVNLGAVDGWMLEGDRTIRFIGATCNALRDGRPHTVDVEVRCSVVVPR